jgi:hypothetical protein
MKAANSILLSLCLLVGLNLSQVKLALGQGSHRSTAIASMARITNCVATPRGVTWTDICSQRNWNTVWICVGD